MKKQINVTLGSGQKALQRQAALELWAESLGLSWGGKGSISKLVQRLADRVSTTPHHYNIKVEAIRERMEENG